MSTAGETPPSIRCTGEGPESRTQAPKEKITGVILAGGLGRRMGGEDKGLLELDGIPLVQRIATVLEPQVGSLLINANRNLERYRGFGYPVIEDGVGDFSGPLAGIASVLQTIETPYLLAVPCDSPLLPPDLVQRLFQALDRDQTRIAVAHDGTRMQPVFNLLARELLPDLLSYIDDGGRRMGHWCREQHAACADFSDHPEAFLNLNTPAEWAVLEQQLEKR